MTHPLSPDLFWLTLSALATGLMWVPYIVRLIMQQGAIGATMDTQYETPQEARWARRCKRAHANAVENLAVFAPLVIVLHLTGAANTVTATLCAVYFFSRLAHFGVYTLGIPVVRTIMFAIGVGCQMWLGLILLGVL